MKAKILVLGGGFGGLYAALEARKSLNGQAEITLVDRNDYFLFTPLLHQIVSATLQPHHITEPFRKLLPPDVGFVRTDVRSVDFDRRTAETVAGPLAYDFLVIALGSVPNFYGIESAEKNAFPFKGLPDALRLRARLLDQYSKAAANPERAPDLIRTVVTGAGCTGIELVAEIHDWMHGPARSLFPGVPPEAASLVLAEALDHLLCPMDPGLQQAAVRQLLSREIDIQLKTAVREVEPHAALIAENGETTRIPTDTVIWAAGIKPSPFINGLSVAKDRRGRIQVSETLQIPEHPEVLAIGDIAACPDPKREFVPPTAQAAVQQAPVAARNIAALVKGRDPRPFRYKNKGEVVDIGHTVTLTEAFGVKFTGLPAWLLGRTLHLARLPDWGDRTTVALEWAKQSLGIKR
jgi:NADH dehydrogenase